MSLSGQSTLSRLSHMSLGLGKRKESESSFTLPHLGEVLNYLRMKKESRDIVASVGHLSSIKQFISHFLDERWVS